MSEMLNALTLPLWGSRLIEASAGTGKTWTVAALYLRLVLGHGGAQGFARPLLPAEILVMTFTRAATPLGDNFSFSAFGTLGAVATNSDEGQYIREFQAKGATKSPSALVDSNLGLQITGKANDWLSGTVQTRSVGQAEADSCSACTAAW